MASEEPPSLTAAPASEATSPLPPPEREPSGTLAPSAPPEIARWASPKVSSPTTPPAAENLEPLQPFDFDVSDGTDDAAAADAGAADADAGATAADVSATAADATAADAATAVPEAGGPTSMPPPPPPLITQTASADDVMPPPPGMVPRTLTPMTAEAVPASPPPPSMPAPPGDESLYRSAPPDRVTVAQSEPQGPPEDRITRASLRFDEPIMKARSPDAAVAAVVSAFPGEAPAPKAIHAMAAADAEAARAAEAASMAAQAESARADAEQKGDEAQPAQADAPGASPHSTAAAADTTSPWDADAGPAQTLDLDHTKQPGSAFEALLSTSAAAPSPQDPPPEAPAPVDELTSLMTGAKELFDLGDFSGSLDLVEKVLRAEPTHEGALAYLKRNEATLMRMYESKLGAMSVVPRQLVPPDEVIWLNMHHRAGFILSQVDGTMSYEDLLEISGMDRFDTVRILAELVSKGIIGAS